MKFLTPYIFIVAFILLPSQQLNASAAQNAVIASIITTGVGLIVSGGCVIGLIRESTCDNRGALACCDISNPAADACNISTSSCGDHSIQRCVVYGKNSTNPVDIQAKPWALGYGVTAIVVGALSVVTPLCIIAAARG